MSWTATDIISCIREVTGTPSQDQLTDAQVLFKANQYLVFSMPAELKVQIETNFLDFKTVPGQDVYSFPGTYLTDSPGAYADGFPLVFYQDPDIFYQDWPQQYAVNTIATGDGVTVTFSGGLQNPPIIMGSMFITDGTQVCQDNGSGVLTGNGTGTINYITGAFSVTFTMAPTSPSTIYAKYIGYSGNRPQGVMFFDNEFTLRPVPDQVYQIRMQGFVKPDPLVLPTDTCQQEEWGPLVAYGTSLQIFSERGDIENYNRFYPVFKRYENVALSRTIQQYTVEQSVPRF